MPTPEEVAKLADAVHDESFYEETLRAVLHESVANAPLEKHIVTALANIHSIMETLHKRTKAARFAVEESAGIDLTDEQLIERLERFMNKSPNSTPELSRVFATAVVKGV